MAVIPIRDVPGQPVNPTGDELILIDNGIQMQKATINDAVEPKATEIAEQKIADLNLGTAAQANVEDFATAAQGQLADSAVQPDRQIIAGDGLTGGGDLSEDRTISLDSASIASLAKADTAVQSVVAGANVTVDATDPQNPVVSVVVGGSDSIFATLAEAQLYAPATAPDFIRVEGYFSAGDGGGALYKKVESEPTHAGKFPITLDDGVTVVWYEIAETVLRPEMFGAEGDGDGAGNGTDDSAAIQLMLDVADGRPCHLDGSKIYKCQKALHMPSNTSIYFNGAAIDFSDITELNDDFNANTKLFLSAKGVGSVDSSALAGDGATGSFSVTVADGSKFQPKDWVQIRAEDFYVYDGNVEVKKGEIKQIESVSGNTVTFTTPLLDNYTTANSAALHKLDFAENIHLDRPRLIGSNVEGDRQEAIRLWWVKGFTVRDCHIVGVDFRNIHIVNSIIGDVDGGYIDGVRYTGVGSTFYAVVTNNSAQWINVRGLKVQECRHLYVCSSSATQYGQPLYVTVSDCHLWNAMAGTGFASYAYEHHGFGRFITITDSTADGCLEGLRVEGPDLKVQRMIFRNIRNHGIRFADGRLLKNIEIDDITISFATADNTGTHIGVWFSTNANADLENVSVTGIRIEDWSATTTDLACRIDPQKSAKNVVLSGWKIHSPTLLIDLQQAFRVEQGNVDLVDMKVHNWPRAFRTYAGANGVNIVNPIVTCDSAPDIAINAIQIDADNCIVMSPVIKNTYRAFSVAGNNNWILNYAVQGAVTTNLDSGNDNILKDAAA